MRTITSLSIGDLVFDNRNFILSEVAGLEMPTSRLPRYNLPGASGAFISNALYGERKIQLKGWVNAPDGSRVTYLNNRATLIDALVYRYDSNNRPLPILVTIDLENGRTITVNAYPSENMPLQMGFSMDQVDYEEFLITLVSPGYVLSSIDAITGNINLPIGGGTPIPAEIPIDLAPSSGGSITIDNTGSVPSFPIITLTAPLTNPYIANFTQGGFLSINYTLEVGMDDMIIDCGAQTIYIGGNNVTGIQTSDSSFFSILPGNNFITFNASAGSGTATILFYPGFLGV